MSGDDAVTIVDSSSVVIADQDGYYDQATKERAYLLWAWDCQQNCAAVGARLGVNERTVRHWSRSGGWRLRHEQERADLDPLDARPVIALRIHSGAVSGAGYLAAVADGLVSEPDVEDIIRREDIGAADKRLLIEARIKSFAAARKDRITASVKLLDAAGFAAINVTGNEHQSSAKVQDAERTNFAALDSGDLAAAERRMRLGSG
jgi:hypothetical protein